VTDQAVRTEATRLWEPGRIGRLQVPNRVLMAPMEKNLCTAGGVITDRYIDYLVERARGDVALLRVEATYVDPVGKGRPFQAGAHEDATIEGLARLAAAVHAAGGRLSVELAHCGRQVDSRVSGRRPVAPSEVPCQASGGYLPRALSQQEIAEIVQRFAAAAMRVQQAGLDAVEIHGASGYLLNSFTSAYTNLRDDEYGGSAERRRRFPLEVVNAVRAAIGPEMPLLYRMSADDCVPGGITPVESGPLAGALEAAGVDLIDVSAGTYESILSTQPPMEAAAGGLIGTAAEIKRHVTIPVATAGKLAHLELAERALAENAIDFVTIGRGLHADPQLLTKTRAGRAAEVRPCIGCAECVAFLGVGPAYCAVNPFTARERSLTLEPAARPRRVVVVGGGPAGLEAARTAALRGHSVTVLERQRRLGGQVTLGALVAGRHPFAEPVEFLGRELERLGVSVRLGVALDPSQIAELEPDVVVVATGVDWSPPASVPSDTVAVVAANEYLAAEAQAAESGDGSTPPILAGVPSAVVRGGDWIGCHVACLLLERGIRVSVVEPGLKLASDMGGQQGEVLRGRVTDHELSRGVQLGCTVERVGDHEVQIWDSGSGETSMIAADLVIEVTRRQPRQALAAQLRRQPEIRFEVRAIGDCVAPAKLQDALLAGATIGAGL
jgi:2,4-dienoyl-CoA reductase-like NADH-dependent reductase (Old Yellow Enzyme family)